MPKRKDEFRFPGAGIGAQPEVRKAIERFRRLPLSQRKGVVSLWGWLLGHFGTPPYKLSRNWIKWSTHPVQGMNCANCQRWYIHAASGTGICDAVNGRWEAEWWCERWTKPLTSSTMSSTRGSDVENFAQLLTQRWGEAQQIPLLQPGQIYLTWEITPNYPHFHTPRGYGVTFFENPARCHMAYAPKILDASVGRADGVVRHEIGHVLDLCLPKRQLDQWAKSRGIKLPRTSERRADAVAEAVWGTPIYYDKKLYVQTTSNWNAVKKRPAHLGL